MYASRRLLSTISSKPLPLLEDAAFVDSSYANVTLLLHLNTSTGSLSPQPTISGTYTNITVTSSGGADVDSIIPKMGTANTLTDFTNTIIRSIRFDGNNDYFYLGGSDASTVLNLGSVDYFISAWIFVANTSTVATQQTILRYSNGTAVSNLNYELRIAANQSAFSFVQYGTNGTLYSTGNIPLTFNAWNYIIFNRYVSTNTVYNASFQVVRPDGTTSGSFGSSLLYSASSGVPSSWAVSCRNLATSRLTLGAGYTGENPFNGAIANLTIANGSNYVNRDSGVPPPPYNFDKHNLWPAIPPQPFTTSTGIIIDAKNTGLTDHSGDNNSYFAKGSALSLSTTSRLGARSLALNGANYLFGGNKDISDLSTSSWTIEFSVRFNVVQNSLLWCSTANNTAQNLRQYIWYKSNALVYGHSATSALNDIMTKNWIPIINKWYALAITRENNLMHMFINGLEVKRAEIGNTSISADGSQFIGGISTTQYPSGNYLNGYIDEFRFTKNICRYNRDYVVRTTEFPNS